MNIHKMRYLADTIYPHYVLASHIYSQGEDNNLLEIQVKIPCHTFKSEDYEYGWEIVTTVSFDDYDTDTFREFILDPVSYLDNMNELGALNIDSLLAHGFEREYNI